jgi:hypothetical protein
MEDNFNVYVHTADGRKCVFVPYGTKMSDIQQRVGIGCLYNKHGSHLPATLEIRGELQCWQQLPRSTN